MINRYISRFILLIAAISSTSFILYFFIDGFGIMEVVRILIFLGFIVIYIQNRELKRMIKELDNKVDKLNS